MDAVIAYVNNNDINWLNSIKQYTNDISLIRFRDFGWLKFLLRGIERYIPYINNLFIIVSDESLIPEWANRDLIRFVLHKEYIPKKILPTFNSCVIESFLPLIPGLDEEFIYFNDDIFPINNIQYKDCFIDGKSVIPVQELILHSQREDNKIYNQNIKNSLELVRKYGNIPDASLFHSYTPMLKSVGCKLLDKEYDNILSFCTMFRDYNNINLYIWPFYSYVTDNSIFIKEKKSYYCVVTDILSFIRFISRRYNSILCINDIENVPNNCIQFITNLFLRIFPLPSKYEIHN